MSKSEPENEMQISTTKGLPFKSIENFQDTELPKFSLIIGPNGSGKTHFLELLSQQLSSNSIIRAQVHTIAGQFRVTCIHYTSETFTLPNDKIMPHLMLPYDSLEEKWSSLTTNPARTALRAQDHPERAERFTVSDAIQEELMRLTREEQLHLFASHERRQDCSTELRDCLAKVAPTQWFKWILTQPGVIDTNPVTPWVSSVVEAIANGGIQEIGRLDADDFSGLRNVDFGRTPILYPLGTAFRGWWTRRELHLVSEAEKLQADCSDGFKKFDVEQPWFKFDRVLEQLGLPFRVTHPEKPTDENPITLIHVDSGKPVQFGDVSSGERTLLALASWVFSKAEGFAGFENPTVLLLDELDAHLHPKMIKVLLELISDLFIEYFKLRVIATTHNVTTVALADEASIFELSKVDDTHQLHKVSKQGAINKLCYGVPSLAIDPSGQRIVFVESTRDQDFYTKVYRMLDGLVTNERSLVFVGSGISKKPSAEPVATQEIPAESQGNSKTTAGGSFGAGKAIVKQYAKNFRAQGSTSVFGLTDWDLVEAPNKDENHFVIAHNERYSLENILLDPLTILVGMSIDPEMRECMESLKDLSPSKILLLPVADKQKLIDEFCARLKCDDVGERVVVSYEGTDSVTLPQGYTNLKGGILIPKLTGEFAPLRKHEKSNTGIYGWIVGTVYHSHLEVIPKNFRHCFESILGHD